MRGFYAIYRKEMSHYFVSPVAYIIVFVFLVLTGIFFTNALAEVNNYANTMAMQSMEMGQTASVDVPSLVLRFFLGTIGIVVLFLTPMLTMGIYSEERKRGTMELLMTSPITDAQIVLGKYFASLSLLAIMLVPAIFYMFYLFGHSDPAAPWRMIPGAFLGLFLLGGALLALGGFMSSLTENQIVSAVSIFGISLVLWLLDIFAQGNGAIAQALQYAAILKHFDPFVQGVIDTTGLVFFGSWIFLGIFLTLRTVESMRWRRA